MTTLLYVARDDKTFGPFSAAQLRRLAAAGKLRLTDTVWKEGLEKEAVSVARVKNLFPPPPAPVPPPAPEPEVSAEPFLPDPVAAVPPAPEPALPDVPLWMGSEEPRLVPEAAPAEKPPLPTPEAPRKRRAIGLKGAILMSQDGVSVRFRKKCSVCGFEDSSQSTMLISLGVTRTTFFCRKCRKSRDVQIQGLMQ